MRTIAHISDLHFGRHSNDVAEALLTSINLNRPDLVVISGDFTQRARRAEFEEARRFLKRFLQPKLVVPGNHDVPLYNFFRRFLGPFTRYDSYIGAVGHLDNFFRDEEIAVLGINTARRLMGKNGRISLDQMAKIGSVYRDVPTGIFKVLVTHHPVAIPGGEAPLKLAGRSVPALKVIADAGVHLLLSGHHHRALSGGVIEVGYGGSILVVHAGTAISTRVRGVEGNTYNLIRTDKERVSVRVMEWLADRGFYESRGVAFVLEDCRWRPLA